jgi:hypothetical protein
MSVIANGDSVVGIGGAAGAGLSLGDGQVALVTSSNQAILQAMVNAGQARLLSTSAVAGGNKRYSAKLTQTGTAAPVATVLENTLGGTLVWTRSSAGVYVGTLAGITAANTLFFMTSVHSVADVTVGTGTVTLTCDADAVLNGHTIVFEVVS